jgi:hypothetical protein
MDPISSLPNEILIGILDHFPTVQLVRLTQVNRRFHRIAAAMVVLRIRHTANRLNQPLIVECYMPSERLLVPSMGATFTRTIGPAGDDLAAISKEYSVFKLFEFAVTWPPTRHVAPVVEGPPTQTLSLDEGQMEVELIMRCLLDLWDYTGYFTPLVATVADGLASVCRRWLLDMAGPLERPDPRWDEGARCISDDGCILWINEQRDMGVRCRVVAGEADHMPVLVGVDDAPPMTFTLELEGEQAILREAIAAHAAQPSTSDRGFCDTHLSWRRRRLGRIPPKRTGVL